MSKKSKPYLGMVTEAVTEYVGSPFPNFRELQQHFPLLSRFLIRLVKKHKLGTLTVTKNNSKTGLPTVSLFSVLTCPEAGKRSGNCITACYDYNSYNYKAPVVVSRAFNTWLWTHYPLNFEKAIAVFMCKANVHCLRMSEGGDIPSQEYLEMIKRLAIKFPDKIIYLYTKSIYFEYKNIPLNLFILVSIMEHSHPRYVKNALKFSREHGFLVAYAGREIREELKSKTVISCPEQITEKWPEPIQCADCKFCFNSRIKKMYQDVMIHFKPHGMGSKYV